MSLCYAAVSPCGDGAVAHTTQQRLRDISLTHPLFPGAFVVRGSGLLPAFVSLTLSVIRAPKRLLGAIKRLCQILTHFVGLCHETIITHPTALSIPQTNENLRLEVAFSKKVSVPIVDPSRDLAIGRWMLNGLHDAVQRQRACVGVVREPKAVTDTVLDDELL